MEAASASDDNSASDGQVDMTELLEAQEYLQARREPPVAASSHAAPRRRTPPRAPAPRWTSARRRG
jgi:hypothetical protein